MPSPTKRLLNLSLRAATLASSFALIFVLARFLDGLAVDSPGHPGKAGKSGV